MFAYIAFKPSDAEQERVVRELKKRREYKNNKENTAQVVKLITDHSSQEKNEKLDNLVKKGSI